MPKAKQKSNRENVDSDDDGPGATQLTQAPTFTQAEKSLKEMAPGDVDRKVNDLVHFLLSMDSKKLPIKRQDISKNVLKECSRAFPILMEKAKEKLDMVFGMDLVTLDSKRYILVNRLENDGDEPHQDWPKEDSARMGLVMLILASIFMNGNVMNQSQLEHLLKKLSLDMEQHHEVFGDLKKLITQEFVRQGYLEYIRQPASDPPTYELKWGERAKSELTKREALNFVCQIYGDIEPEQWKSQFADIQKSEKGRGVEVEEETAGQAS